MVKFILTLPHLDLTIWTILLPTYVERQGHTLILSSHQYVAAGGRMEIVPSLDAHVIVFHRQMKLK